MLTGPIDLFSLKNEFFYRREDSWITGRIARVYKTPTEQLNGVKRAAAASDVSMAEDKRKKIVLPQI